jgi:hypothetical protein
MDRGEEGARFARNIQTSSAYGPVASVHLFVGLFVFTLHNQQLCPSLRARLSLIFRAPPARQCVPPSVGQQNQRQHELGARPVCHCPCYAMVERKRLPHALDTRTGRRRSRGALVCLQPGQPSTCCALPDQWPLAQARTHTHAHTRPLRKKRAPGGNQGSLF